MALFAWNIKYSVNIKIIDDQHQKLVELLNTLHEKMKEGKGKESLKSILDELINYTLVHFKTEEDYFDKYRYPDSKAHKEEHAILVRQVRAIKKELDEGRTVLTVDVLEFLKEWLTSHIMESDKKYSPFFNSNGIK